MGPDLHKEKQPTLQDLYLGRSVDGYEFLERIGEGGMGAVYRVRRAGDPRDLAIKVIKRGMDTHTILRRFHNERRILETLRHDNIATMLDAGTTPQGLPYFVMEFIPGQPIGEYCDSRRLSIDDRLRLFQKVCAAVQCAHEAHVVHRDIKPENILVTAAGEPKLLDFGIAKVLDFTSPSHDVTITLSPVMTPHYASPEQARAATITAASDIYSLGVLLYELLAGVSPYRTPGAGAPSLVHAICNERPQSPSATTSTTAIAQARSTDGGELRRTLSGDLDAIILTALEKAPARRYRSVAAFSADIASHLDGRRVDALKLSRRYARLGPRVKQAIVASFVLMVCAILFAVFYRPSRGRLTVRPSVAVLGFENLSHEASAEWLSTALTEMLSTELAAGGRLRTVPGELVGRVKHELALPNAQTFAAPTLTRLRDSLSADYVVLGSYLALGEGAARQLRLDLRLQDTRNGDVVATASETRSAVELAGLVTGTGALLRRQLGAGAATADAAQRGSLPESADAARLYAEGLERLRSFDTLAARDLLRNAVATAPDHALSHAALAGANGLLGYDVEAREEARKALDLSAGLGQEERLSIEGRYLETSRDWKRAVETYRSLREAYPDNLEYGLRLAAAQTQSGEPRRAIATVAELRALPSAVRDPRVDLAEAEAGFAAGDLAAARAAAGRAAQSSADQGLRTLTAGARILESRVAIASGDPQAALTAATQAQQLYLSASHRQGVAQALTEAAGALNQRGDVAGARARYEEALTVCRTIGDQTCIGSDLDSLGVLRRRQGDLRGALDMHSGALDVRRAVGDRNGVATSLYNIGNVLEIIGDLPKARQAADEALQIRRQLGERRTAALTLSRLANIRRREGALDDALQKNQEALAALRSVADRGGVAMALINLGLTLYDRGELVRAQSVFDEALEIRRQQRDRNNIAQLEGAISRISLAQDRLREAASLIAESTKLRQELGEHVGIALNDLIRSEILLEQNDATGAERAARDAGAAFRRAGAWGREAEAAVGVARAAVARSDAARAAATLDSAAALFRNSKDARLLLRRDVILAMIRHAQGRADEAAAILDRALVEARRLGMNGVVFEIRHAMLQIDRPAPGLSADARSAGFLLIARKTR